MNTDYPTAHVIRREPNPNNPGFVVLEVVCPYCRRHHHHGGAQGDTDHGHRVSHCPGTEPPNLGYIVREAQ